VVKLETTLRINAPIERCFDLARSVEVHVAGNRHWGEEAVALEGVTSGLLGLGDRVTWRAPHFCVRQRLTSEITAFDRPRYAQDRMSRGTFAWMEYGALAPERWSEAKRAMGAALGWRELTDLTGPIDT
jgi:hypothetical protein